MHAHSAGAAMFKRGRKEVQYSISSTGRLSRQEKTSNIWVKLFYTWDGPHRRVEHSIQRLQNVHSQCIKSSFGYSKMLKATEQILTKTRYGNAFDRYKTALPFNEETSENMQVHGDQTTMSLRKLEKSLHFWEHMDGNGNAACQSLWCGSAPSCRSGKCLTVNSHL